MPDERLKIIQKGDQSGNGMVFKVTPENGPEIYGMGTKNFYGGNWDLGPTWNYLVLADEPFLVDTGRTGTIKSLVEMIERTGFSIKSLKTIVLSHGHEDHDGGLPDLVRLTGAKVTAHPIYRHLIKLAPDHVPDGVNKKFPPSCWHCVMPESFTNDFCSEYHINRNNLVIEDICAQKNTLGKDIQIMQLPGHSPDAIGIMIGSEVFIAGDNVLPHISPMPSKRESLKLIGRIFPADQPEINQRFGLEVYLKTLKTLKQMGENYSDLLTLPGHRIYYNNQWNAFQLAARSQEIINSHIKRCGDIKEILKMAPKTIREIMTAHFKSSQLEGMGFYMAKNEIQSHLELLIDCENIETIDSLQYSDTAKNDFESYIHSLEPWQETMETFF